MENNEETRRQSQTPAPSEGESRVAKRKRIESVKDKDGRFAGKMFAALYCMFATKAQLFGGDEDDEKELEDDTAAAAGQDTGDDSANQQDTTHASEAAPPTTDTSGSGNTATSNTSSIVDETGNYNLKTPAGQRAYITATAKRFRQEHADLCRNWDKEDYQAEVCYTLCLTYWI